MLITLDFLCSKFNLDITGILHVGAHECEELEFYLKQGINNDDIYWIEAMDDKVKLMKKKNKNLNIFQAVIDSENNKEIIFNIANNSQSSSILEFGTHSKHHRGVKMISKKKLITTRLDKLINEKKIKIENINYLNLDIQGKELDALKSMGNYIQYIQYIYTEVNTEKVYKDCALLTEIDEFLKEKGFTRVAVKMYNKCGWGDAFYIRE